MKNYTALEFAKECGISYTTLNRYMNKGLIIPRRTLGGKIYFCKADIKAYLAHNSSEPLIFAETPRGDEENDGI